VELSNPMRHMPIQRKPLKVILIVAFVGILLALSGIVYIYISGGSALPSAAITAPSLEVSGNAKLFHILPEQSEVRFITNEVLLGQPKTVVGTTNEVAGDLAVDFDNPTNSRVGAIRINVKTLQTDNEFRNRALRGQILMATRPEFEFVSFVPKRIAGLPTSIRLGEKFTFQVVGDLTLRGATREVTFDAEVTPVDHTHVKGSAWATIHYGDFNITIPDAPGVANVSETVRLEISFAAAPANN
jgi:polyisoprenoid-binding protein YceI